MKPKYSALLLLTVLLLFSSALAQSGGDLNDRLARLKTELKLTPEQFKEVAKLLVEMDIKADENSSEFGSDEESLRGATQKLRKKTSRRMKKILSPDQFEAYEKLAARSRMRDQWAFYDRLLEELSLTDSQQAEIKPIIDEYQKQVDELRKGMRGEGMDRSARQELFAKMTAHSERMTKAVKELLTEDQQAEFDKFMEENRSRRGRRGGSGGGQHGGRGSGRSY